MKRIFALALAITVLFSYASFAMETDKTEEVLASVKERIPGTDSFDTFDNKLRNRIKRKNALSVLVV